MTDDFDRWRREGRTFRHAGHAVFYRTEGEGPALVALHGFPSASWDWHPMWPELVARFRVVAPDMMPEAEWAAYQRAAARLRTSDEEGRRSSIQAAGPGAGPRREPQGRAARESQPVAMLEALPPSLVGLDIVLGTAADRDVVLRGVV